MAAPVSQSLRVDAEPGQAGVGDIREQPPVIGLGGRLKGGPQLLDGLLVTGLQHAECLIDAEPVTSSVGIGLVMRQDRDQAVRVTGIGSQHDTAPEAVHPEKADPVIQAAARLLQVPPGVRALGELGDHSLHRAPRVLVELRVFSQEAFRDRQASHWLSFPLPAVPES